MINETHSSIAARNEKEEFGGFIILHFVLKVEALIMQIIASEQQKRKVWTIWFAECGVHLLQLLLIQL